MRNRKEVERMSNQQRKPLLLPAFLAAFALALTAGVAKADSWILPIAVTQGGGWTTLSGAGYNGTDALEGSGMDGTRRIYWKLDPTLLGVGGSLMPSGMNLYLISWYQPSSGGADWQPIESQFEGSAGEIWPMDPNIPWIGAFGSNHEYIGTDNGTPGTWEATGPGPHTPEDASYNAGANGIYMWLNIGTSMDNSSWLYAKWDYPWSIDHAWSAIEVTLIPEPSVLALSLLGGLALLTGLRRAKH